MLRAQDEDIDVNVPSFGGAHVIATASGIRRKCRQHAAFLTMPIVFLFIFFLDLVYDTSSVPSLFA